MTLRSAILSFAKGLAVGLAVSFAAIALTTGAFGGEPSAYREGYPMNIIATEPPVAEDVLQGGEGYMFDGSRFKGYVLPDEHYVLCRTSGGVNCGLLPAGTVLLVPALADTL